jgi:hypothetical protein
MKTPSEQSEHLRLVVHLRRGRIPCIHVPNGGARAGGRRGLGAAEGVRAGFPDFLVWRSPSWVDPTSVDIEGLAAGLVVFPRDTRATKGLALELKRQGGRWRDVAPEQRECLAELHAEGFAVSVAYGARDAVAKLTALGYDLALGDPLAHALWPQGHRVEPSPACPFCELNNCVLRLDVPGRTINGCSRCCRSWEP